MAVVVGAREGPEVGCAEVDGDVNPLERAELLVHGRLVLEILDELVDGGLADDCVSVLQEGDLERDRSGALLSQGGYAVVQGPLELLVHKAEPGGVADRVAVVVVAVVKRDVGTVPVERAPLYHAQEACVRAELGATTSAAAAAATAAASSSAASYGGLPSTLPSPLGNGR